MLCQRRPSVVFDVRTDHFVTTDDGLEFFPDLMVNYSMLNKRLDSVHCYYFVGFGETEREKRTCLLQLRQLFR